MDAQTLMKTYAERRPEIEARLREFASVWRKRDKKRILEELVFCLLTPQSKARACWRAVERLKERGLLRAPDPERVAGELVGVRFPRSKARYVTMAVNLFGKILRKLLDFEDAEKAREWLVKNVKGLGYKEASHFLRNIGYSENLAILDRHVLKNLHQLGVLDEIPRSLSPKTYLEIEGRMRKFSREVGIPLGHLDLLLWSMETGEVFK